MLDPNRRVHAATEPAESGEPAPVGTVAASLAAAKASLFYYLSTRTDRVLLLVKNAVVFAVLGVVAGLVAVTVVVTSTVYLCSGIVGGLEQLLGRYAWLAPLLFGAIVLGSAGLLGLIVIRRFSSGSKERLVSAYERRQRQQRSKVDPGTNRRGTTQSVG